MRLCAHLDRCCRVRNNRSCSALLSPFNKSTKSSLLKRSAECCETLHSRRESLLSRCHKQDSSTSCGFSPVSPGTRVQCTEHTSSASQSRPLWLPPEAPPQQPRPRAAPPSCAGECIPTSPDRSSCPCLRCPDRRSAGDALLLSPLSGP